MSAKGSPGTTTTALLCAALWPRPALLVDADTDGGDVALRLRREDGEPVDRDRGLLSLLSLARRELSPSVLVQHAQVLRGGTELISGLAGPDQAGAAQLLWDNLGRAFAGATDHDVLLDCGRVSSMSTHLPLLQRADLIVCVLRPTVSGVIHTRDRLTDLQPVLGLGQLVGPRVGVVVVGGSRSNRDVSGASSLLRRDLPGVEMLGVLPDDGEGASVLSGVELPRPERTLLVRSAHPLVATLAALVCAPVDPASMTGAGAARLAGPGRGRRLAARKMPRLLGRGPDTAAGAAPADARSLDAYVAAAAEPPGHSTPPNSRIIP